MIGSGRIDRAMRCEPSEEVAIKSVGNSILQSEQSEVSKEDEEMSRARSLVF